MTLLLGKWGAISHKFLQLREGGGIEEVLLVARDAAQYLAIHETAPFLTTLNVLDQE